MAWLSDWNKRIKLTISGSCVEGDLSDFPIMVYLDSTCSGVFNELGANSKKIAVTISGEVSQCYVEVENWDNGNNKAWLWTKVPTLFSGIDTDLYLYYDSTKSDNTLFVGDVSSVVAQNVWDSNFEAVYHMSQDPSGGAGCIKDSTSNANHGTTVGTMTSGNLVGGKVGKALDFDGTDDGIDCNFNTNYSNFTLECILNKDVDVSSGCYTLINKSSYYALTTNDFPVSLRIVSDQRTQLALDENGSDFSADVTLYSSPVDNNYHYVACANGSIPKLYLDNNLVDQGVSIDPIDNTRNWFIGRASFPNGGGATINQFDGVIDEARISSSARSAAWIKATYYSNWNQLLNYGNEENIFHCCFSGVVKVEDVPSVRKVNLYAQSTGELIKCTTSSGGTGEWAINVCGDINAKYFVVCVPESDSRNAEVFANLIGV